MEAEMRWIVVGFLAFIAMVLGCALTAEAMKGSRYIECLKAGHQPSVCKLAE